MIIDNCIVGLGNPGAKYFNTRHNAGFRVVDKLSEFFNIKSFEYTENFLAAPAIYKEKNLVLIKSLTFMNLSGKAVKLASEMFGIAIEKFLVIYDDVNIDFGTLRIRAGGSDGGQNGMASVIYEMETEEIPRLRVGIKNQPEIEKLGSEDGTDLAGFVLSPFTEDETKDLDKIINTAKNAVLCYIDEGITSAMNSFNRNVLE